MFLERRADPRVGKGQPGMGERTTEQGVRIGQEQCGGQKMNVGITELVVVSLFSLWK